MALTLLKPRLMIWNALNITDHNRSGLSVDVERIETAKRMANGTMRKYVVADKRTFSCSWEMLPNSSAFTIDGFAGADEIENFYNLNKGAFTLTLTYKRTAGELNHPDESFNVMFTDFSKKLDKRGKFDFYDVDVTMEEV
jgi:hypothetical protein